MCCIFQAYSLTEWTLPLLFRPTHTMAFTMPGVARMLSPCSGACGQVMKAVSSKFHPIFQWFYFDSIESLPDNLPLPAEEVTLLVGPLPQP